jgi:hypothetical protein
MATNASVCDLVILNHDTLATTQIDSVDSGA